MQKAVVVIPTYNERENIVPVTDALMEVFKQVPSWQMEILVVDDSSPDKTYELVEELSKKNRTIHLLINKKKAGLGAAYIKGMDHAINELGAEVVFEFDADLSHDPKKIPEFMKKIDEGYDLVLGARYIPGGGIPDDWGFHRKFLSIVGNTVITLVFTNFSIHDWTTGYRALTKEAYLAIRPHITTRRFSGYTFQIGLLHTAIRLGFKVAEVPFKFIDRTYGESKLGTEYIKNTLIYIFQARFEEIVNHRVFKFAFVGGTGALVQLITLNLWRLIFPYQLAFFLAIELAVLSNFLLNNIWTFSDRKLAVSDMPGKFIQFNIASAGSIVIQQVIALIGEYGIGLFPLFTLPIINFTVETGTIYAVAGILIGMFWNFFAYTKFIWKKST